MYRCLVKDPPEPFQIIFLAFEIFCIFKSLYPKLTKDSVLSQEAQSPSPATSNRIARSARRHSSSSVPWVCLEVSSRVGHAWNTLPGRHPRGIFTRCRCHQMPRLLSTQRSSASTLAEQVSHPIWEPDHPEKKEKSHFGTFVNHLAEAFSERLCHQQIKICIIKVSHTTCN